MHWLVVLGFTVAGLMTPKATYSATFAPFLDVRDFGAVGDGVADDTRAIQEGINAAASKGMVLRLGPNAYRIRQLTLPADTSNKVSIVEGAGPNHEGEWGTRFLCSPRVDCIVATAPVYSRPMIVLRNLTLVGPDTATPRTRTSGNGIAITGAANFRVRLDGVTAYNFFGQGKAGIWLENVMYSSLRDVRVYQPDVGLKLTTDVNSNSFDNVTLDQNASYGLFADWGHANQFRGTIQSNERTGVYIANSTAWRFAGTYFENNNSTATAARHAVEIVGRPGQPVMGVHFDQCFFTTRKDTIALGGSGEDTVKSVRFTGGRVAGQPDGARYVIGPNVAGTVIDEVPNGVAGSTYVTFADVSDSGRGTRIYAAGAETATAGMTARTLEAFEGVTLAAAVSLLACTGAIEGRVTRAGGTGGAGTRSRTRVCVCTSDGASSPRFAWQNLATGAVGSQDTCPP